MLNKEREKYYIELIKTSFSLREVCLKAGIVVTTGNYKTLKHIITTNNIDISHFKRQHPMQQEVHELNYYLCENSTISSFRLKNKLFNEKVKEKKCECCGLTEWLGQPINLELHHINGNNIDNRLENLQILCPNCHSYTDNYGGKNQKLNINPKTNITNNTSKKEILSQCDNKKNIKETKINYNVENMISLMKKYKNYTQVGKELGISDNAVKKRFIKLGYANNIKDLIKELI